MALLLIRCCVLIFAFSPILWRVYVRYRWTPASGTIMRIEQQLVDGEGWGWVVTVEFQARGRQWIFVRPYAQIFGSAPRYRVYDQIAIRYDANNPERVAFDEWRGYVGASVATGIIGIILASQLH